MFFCFFILVSFYVCLLLPKPGSLLNQTQATFVPVSKQTLNIAGSGQQYKYLTFDSFGQTNVVLALWCEFRINFILFYLSKSLYFVLFSYRCLLKMLISSCSKLYL